MTNLKRCPFCDSVADLHIDEAACPAVICAHCDCQTTWYKPGCEEDAVAAWNSRATPADTCKPGGCSAIGCEGGHYCFDANGVARPIGDPLALARAIFPNVESRATPADHSVPVAWLTYSAFTGKPQLSFEQTSELASVPLFAAPQPPQNAADHIEAQSVRAAWISVNDELPGYPRTVLVAYQSDADGEPCLDVGEAIRYPNGEWEGLGVFYALGQDRKYQARAAKRIVTHWMPMPAPPQKPVSDEVKS